MEISTAVSLNQPNEDNNISVNGMKLIVLQDTGNRERKNDNRVQKGNHVIIPMRLIFAERKECKVKTKVFGQVRRFSSCVN